MGILTEEYGIYKLQVANGVNNNSAPINSGIQWAQNLYKVLNGQIIYEGNEKPLELFKKYFDVVFGDKIQNGNFSAGEEILQLFFKDADESSSILHIYFKHNQYYGTYTTIGIANETIIQTDCSYGAWYNYSGALEGLTNYIEFGLGTSGKFINLHTPTGHRVMMFQIECEYQNSYFSRIFGITTAGGSYNNVGTPSPRLVLLEPITSAQTIESKYYTNYGIGKTESIILKPFTLPNLNCLGFYKTYGGLSNISLPFEVEERIPVYNSALQQYIYQDTKRGYYPVMDNLLIQIQGDE